MRAVVIAVVMIVASMARAADFPSPRGFTFDNGPGLILTNPVTGTCATTGGVAFFSATSTIACNAAFVWTDATKILTIQTAGSFPGVRVQNTSSTGEAGITIFNDLGITSGFQVKHEGSASGGTFLNTANANNAIFQTYGTDISAIKFGTDVNGIPIIIGNRCTACGDASGMERISIDTSGDFIVNELGLSYEDMRVEGDTDTNLFKTDAANNKVYVGTSTAVTGAKLTVSDNLGLSGVAHVITDSNAPSVDAASTCTAITMAGKSTDTAFQVIATCTVGQTVVINFANTYNSNSPICVLSCADADCVTDAFSFNATSVTQATATAQVGSAISAIFNGVCVESN